ncbi:uncharacterized protein C8Q71DRAFT_123312 [Rhodofomes roseus]|uniref:Secreted protein n=1 Tax=Rhodofomes roseus TaxID=34475 RepID=A0ABQ8KBF1_9APHY|nr:uncharacterized protein C8Q71DRAFT_123312 [Rhodofomes roseus]KAH9834762.1 hypothetical protein C8Q71DRAFT_123312 [Rhodofomes roseus]
MLICMGCMRARTPSALLLVIAAAAGSHSIPVSKCRCTRSTSVMVGMSLLYSTDSFRRLHNGSQQHEAMDNGRDASVPLLVRRANISWEEAVV